MRFAGGSSSPDAGGGYQLPLLAPLQPFLVLEQVRLIEPVELRSIENVSPVFAAVAVTVYEFAVAATALM